jgi:DNA transformation protein and related proteins
MKKISDFVDNLREVFTEFGPIEVKGMFGGYGLFRDGLMFALVADDVLYLKSDKGTAAMFHDRGLPAFEYEKGGKKISMSYFQAPEEVFDESNVAKEWADLAFGAALRAKNATVKKDQGEKDQGVGVVDPLAIKGMGDQLL